MIKNKKKLIAIILTLIIYNVIINIALKNITFASNNKLETILIGTISSNKQNDKIIYEFVSESNEKYKIIGPKVVINQILKTNDYQSKKFLVNCKVIIKNSKKGILINNYKVYNQPENLNIGSSEIKLSSSEINLLISTPEIILLK